MTEKKALPTLADLFAITDDAQFGRVIVQATFLEKLLEVLLEGRMEMSGKLRRDLFVGKNAPLSSFSAKIDMCCALGLINADQRTVLHNVRKIRNVFAHADMRIDFDHPKFKSDNYVKGNPLGGSEAAFHSAIKTLMTEIKPGIENAMLVKALREAKSDEGLPRRIDASELIK